MSQIRSKVDVKTKVVKLTTEGKRPVLNLRRQVPKKCGCAVRSADSIAVHCYLGAEKTTSELTVKLD